MPDTHSETRDPYRSRVVYRLESDSHRNQFLPSQQTCRRLQGAGSLGKGKLVRYQVVDARIGFQLFCGPLVANAAGTHRALHRQLLGDDHIREKVERPIALGRSKDHPATASGEVERGEHCFRIVRGDVDHHVGSPAESAGDFPGHICLVHVYGEVRTKLSCQLETVSIVGEASDAHPSGTGGLGSDETGEASRSRSKDEQVFTRLKGG